MTNEAIRILVREIVSREKSGINKHRLIDELTDEELEYLGKLSNKDLTNA